MNVKQISVFVENKKGRLAEITKALGENDIDISALSIADTTDFGILRLIVNKPDLAAKILKDKGLAVKATEVIAISVADKPGGLAAALEKLDAEHMSIEYMYAFVGKRTSEALVIIRVEEPDKAVSVLEKNGIKVITNDEVYSL